MTYNELLEILNSMTPDQLNQNVTVCVTDQEEYWMIDQARVSLDNDVLDDGHVYLRTVVGE